MRYLQTAIIGDSTIDSEQYDFCENLGAFLASRRIIVLTGGRGGVMEAVSKGVFINGGISVSILPSDTADQANEYSTVVIPTGMGDTRNSLLVRSGDIVITIGGKAGTLSEISFAWIYNKPLIAVKQFGGWSAKLSDLQLDDRRTDTIIGVTGFKELETAIIQITENLGWKI